MDEEQNNARIEELPAEIGGFLGELLATVLDSTQQFVTLYGHSVVLAVLTLSLGWLIAAFAGKLTAKVLMALGFDVIAERIGARRFLAKAEITRRPSSLVGFTVYGVLVWMSVMLSFERLGLDAAAAVMRNVLTWIPRAAVAIVLIVIGAILARHLGRIVARASRLADIPFAESLGHITRGVVLVVTGAVAIEQMGLASGPTILGALGILAVFGLLAAAGLAIFAKEAMANLFARQIVAREFRIGESVRFGGVSGTLCSLGATGARLRDGEHEYLVPHHRLLAEVIERRPCTHRRDAPASRELPPRIR